MTEVREKYLLGKLTEKEKADFEASLSKEEKAELAYELGVQAALVDESRDLLRKKVAGFEDRYTKAKKVNWAYMSVAASFLIVATFTVLLLNTQPSTGELYDEYFELYPNYEVPIVRGEAEGTITDRERAYQLYDTGKFQESAEKFELLDPMMDSDKFFLAMCYMKLSKWEAAKTKLAEVSNGTTDYAETANWYIALIYLQLDQSEKSVEVLSNVTGEYAEKAKLLKEDL